jgi:hypothetical protein
MSLHCFTQTPALRPPWHHALQVRVELSDEQRELYKAILSKNYDTLAGA